MIYDTSMEQVREYFQKKEDEADKKEFLKKIEELTKASSITPIEFYNLVEESCLRFDKHLVLTLLLRKSHSLVRIKSSVIKEYFLPSINPKIVRESTLLKISNTASLRTDQTKYELEVPYEEMNEKQQADRQKKFLFKLADFLFDTQQTIQMIMQPKIFDKVIDGIEYR